MRMSQMWAVASVLSGIDIPRRTRREAVADLGFATGIKRRARRGNLYEYTSGAGLTLTVGRIRDLLADGFSFYPETE